jgi:hypothetical protein
MKIISKHMLSISKKYALLVLASGTLLSGCVKDDLLDRTDPSGVDEAKAWTTDYMTNLGMNGVYAGLRLGMQNTTATPIGYEHYQFDRYAAGQGRALDFMMSGNPSTSANLFYYLWRDMYEGIGRANDAIYNIPIKSESSEADKAKFVAEAKFLRAYFYFRLNQVYKGVPIYEDPMVASDAQRLRNTEQEVWDLIIQDLTDCINEVNIPNKIAAGNGDYGRVTKGAAYALRGKVYVYMKEWSKAVSDFEAVENCGHSLFQGGYKQLFKEANEQSDEMIFSIQNIPSPTYGSSIQLFCGTRSSEGSCWNNYLVPAISVDKYENLDGSVFNWDDYIPGYNAMNAAHREVYFLRDTYDLENKLIADGFTGDAATEAAAITEAVQIRLDLLPANIQALYLPDGNEARIAAAYANRDPRLHANVITPYSTYVGALSGADHEVTLRWPFRNDAKGVQDLKSDWVANGVYFHRKFVSEGVSELADRMYVGIDHPIIRFADVLLMKAEALNELGQLGNAITEVNRVRARAGVASLNTSSVNTVSDKAALEKRIRNERWVEFLNEGIAYFDEIRWGTWKESVFDAAKGGQLMWGSLYNTYTWFDDDRKGYMWPIPQTEMDRNPNLVQNPGWE